MANKTLFMAAAFFAASTVFGADAFVSQKGGLWSDPSAWRDKALPLAPVNLRMDAFSGNFEIDGQRAIANLCVWGKPQNIHIYDGATLTIGSLGINVQNVPTCVSGSGFLRFQSDALVCYGGSGGRLNIVGNAIANKIVFDGSRKLLKSAAIRMAQPMDRIFKTTLNDKGGYSDLSIIGAPNANSRVEFLGNTTVGDIDIVNNAYVLFNTPRLFMFGQYKKIEVSNSTIELARAQSQYSIYGKVRLNGGATLVLRGDPYDNFVNMLFIAGKTNTVVVADSASLGGFCVYNNGKADGRTVKIVLPKKAGSGVLRLKSIIHNPGSNMCLKSNSLSLDGKGNAVGDISIEIENFANGAITVENGFDNPDDYAKIRAKGWGDFRLANGVLIATKK